MEVRRVSGPAARRKPCAGRSASVQSSVVTRTPSARDAPAPSPLVVRHVEDVYRDEPAPPDAVERISALGEWFGTLPRVEELPPHGATLVDDFRALKSELRGRMTAFALQGGTGILSAAGRLAAEKGFIELTQRGDTRWTSDLHRVVVLAAADCDDHRFAGRLRSAGRPSPHGGALHLLFAGESVDPDDLVIAADYFTRADRPSWAIHCLVAAADAAQTPEQAAMLAARAVNVAAYDGDLLLAERLMERYTPTDTRMLLRESAPGRALRQILLETDTGAAVSTIRRRLRSELDAEATSEALAAYAIIGLFAGGPTEWAGFIEECVAASVSLHPEIIATAATMTDPNILSEPHLALPTAVDGRGWVQLAGCAATIMHQYREMRLGSFTPSTEGPPRAGNRLVRGTEVFHVSLMLANNQYWNELDAVLEVSEQHSVTASLPVPHLRVAAEALRAYAAAFRGDRDRAQTHVNGALGAPVLRRAHRTRAMLDSAVALIEAPQGNYEHAMAILSTRQTDAAYLTFGPCGPSEMFDFVDYALMIGEETAAAKRVEEYRETVQLLQSARADFVLSACDAILAARRTLAPAEELLALAEGLPFVYETARLRLVYAEHLRRARRITEARRHLLRADLELRSVQAGAWTDRVQRELRACHREVNVHVGHLTDQEKRIATFAAEGLSNKEIGARLHLSPRTVGGHLYKIFPKLGITTRAQLPGALSLTETTPPEL